MFARTLSPAQFGSQLVHDPDFGPDFHSRMEATYAGLSDRAKGLAAEAFGFTAETKSDLDARKSAMDRMPLCSYDLDGLIEFLEVLGHVYQQEPNAEIRQYAIVVMGEMKGQRGAAHLARLLGETKLPPKE